MPGPFCSMILADLGARVIKVEPPGGDPLRHTPGMFASVNRGKQSLVLNLKVPSAQAFLGRLAGACDVVLEGWRPGVAARLGADYATLSGQNPRLVYCSVSGFGQAGPWRERPAHDVNFLALGGYLGVQAMIEGRPWPPPVLISDLATGLYAAIGILAAIAARSVSGQGAHVDLAMADAVVALLGPEIGRASTEGVPSSHPNVTFLPHYGLFPCADGCWMSLGIVHEDYFWERLCRSMGLDDLAGLAFPERVAQAERVREALYATFLRRPAVEWEHLLNAVDVPAAAVNTLDELLESPQFRARDLFTQFDGAWYVAQPMRFSSGSVTPIAGPPALGEHTDAILTEFETEYKVDPAVIASLRASSAVGSQGTSP